MIAADHLFLNHPPGKAVPPLPGLMRAFPDAFSSLAAARRFVQLIWFPPSRAWRYQLNGKSGNTFVLNLLFELEFGVPFTVRVDPAQTGNQHPDFALFAAFDAGLYSNALREEDRLSGFIRFPGLSLATVRAPHARVLSAFFYLCRSHKQGDRRFLSERIRINALAGLDWDAQADTPEGFARFLAYVEQIADGPGPDTLDPHWMPQALHIRPDIYRPDLVGRTEDMSRFAAELARRLDKPLPHSLQRLRTNKTARPETTAFFQPPEIRAVIDKVYRDDFELFEYPRL